MTEIFTEMFLGDCLEIMKLIPDESIDLILTDPPYLINYKTNHRKDKKHRFCKEILNDNNPDIIIKSIEQFNRVLKNNSALYIFCSQDKLDFFKQEVEKYFNLKNTIIWVKNNWTAGDLEAQYGKQYEVILYANKGRRKINGKRLTDVWFFDRVSGKSLLHQNQKPVELLKQIIEKSSNESDKILDPFMGVGSTLIAARELNRNSIGIEIDEEYYNIAKERLKIN